MTAPAEQAVLREIGLQGRISFARFMELALYAPGAGYYTSGTASGNRSDYFTAPRAHPVFGALLALQVEQMWQLLGQPPSFTLLEPGAGSGELAWDVLRYIDENFPTLAQCLTYLTVDFERPSLLADGSGTQSVISAGLPVRNITGCILANELLDAFPVHRFIVQGGEILEVYVTIREGSLVEEFGPLSSSDLEDQIKHLGRSLPDGFQGEINLALIEWIRSADRALGNGFLLLIDYGGTSEELYSPERKGGTLRSFFRHTQSGTPYQRVGLQDLTAHVNFSLVLDTAQQVGLVPLGYTTQREFLRNLGVDAFLKALTRRTLPSGKRYASQMGIRELLRMGGMGEFKVLALGKNVTEARLYGFSFGNTLVERLHRTLDTLEVPEPTGHHARLLEAKYPHLAYNFQDRWF